MVSDEEIDVLVAALTDDSGGPYFILTNGVEERINKNWVLRERCAQRFLALKAERAERIKPIQSIDAEIGDLALKIAVQFYFGTDIEKMSSLQQSVINEVKERVLDGYVLIASPYHERMYKAEAALAKAQEALQWYADNFVVNGSRAAAVLEALRRQ